VLGEKHPDTVTSSSNLAINQQAQGQYQNVEETYRKVLALATYLKTQGRYSEAAEGFRQALALSRNSLGEEHPSSRPGRRRR
jgi:tetratricopeptide (TPR) repeat protein